MPCCLSGGDFLWCLQETHRQRRRVWIPRIPAVKNADDKINLFTVNIVGGFCYFTEQKILKLFQRLYFYPTEVANVHRVVVMNSTSRNIKTIFITQNLISKPMTTLTVSILLNLWGLYGCYNTLNVWWFVFN